MSMSTETGRVRRLPIQRRGPRLVYRSVVLVTWVVLAFAAARFLEVVGQTRVPAASSLGRWFGLIGAVLFGVLALYGLRRIWYRGRLGSLEFWYRFHLLGGLVALVLVGLHSGFAVRSLFLGLLQVGFWGTTGTGVLGWLWQTGFKTRMAQVEPRPAVPSDLLRERAELLSEVSNLTQEGGGFTSQLLESAIHRAARVLALGRLFHLWRLPTWSFWEKQFERTLQRSQLPPLPAGGRDLLARLHRVEVLCSYHRLLRWWPTVHLLFTALAVTMMGWHLYLVATYPR